MGERLMEDGLRRAKTLTNDSGPVPIRAVRRFLKISTAMTQPAE